MEGEGEQVRELQDVAEERDEVEVELAGRPAEREPWAVIAGTVGILTVTRTELWEGGLTIGRHGKPHWSSTRGRCAAQLHTSH